MYRYRAHLMAMGDISYFSVIALQMLMVKFSIINGTKIRCVTILIAPLIECVSVVGIVLPIGLRFLLRMQSPAREQYCDDDFYSHVLLQLNAGLSRLSGPWHHSKR